MYVKITPSRARVVKSVDTADLKSAAYKTGMPVRFRPRAPFQSVKGCYGYFFFTTGMRFLCNCVFQAGRKFLEILANLFVVE